MNTGLDTSNAALSDITKSFMKVFLDDPDAANYKLAQDIQNVLSGDTTMSIDDLVEECYVLSTFDRDDYGFQDYTDTLHDFVHDPSCFNFHKQEPYFKNEISISMGHGDNIVLPAPKHFKKSDALLSLREQAQNTAPKTIENFQTEALTL